jgi:hypothetical protein
MPHPAAKNGDPVPGNSQFPRARWAFHSPIHLPRESGLCSGHGRWDGVLTRLAQSPGMASRSSPDHRHIGGGRGWGLRAVGGLASGWGCDPLTDGQPGKIVWAEVACLTQIRPCPPMMSIASVQTAGRWASQRDGRVSTIGVIAWETRNNDLGSPSKSHDTADRPA